MDSIFSGFSNAYKQNHIINDIIFPGSSSNSYSWGMFQQDELICLQTTGAKAMEIPCLLIKGYQREGDRRTMLPASTLLVYCHANSEDLGSVYPCAKWMSQMLGIHVLVPEYPGYGLCSGSPNEQSINAAVQENAKADLRSEVLYGDKGDDILKTASQSALCNFVMEKAACQFAIEELMQDASRIIIYGRSIGTGPSVLAARARLAGTCVLISPYSSIKQIVEFHVGSVIGLLAHGASEWDSKRLIEDVQIPTLIIHGTSDEIIPSRHAEELYERCPARKRLVLLENVGHQEMDLLYALVQTLPEIHQFSDEPWEINLENLDHVLFECRTANSPTGEERIVPVYKIAPREEEVEVGGGHREDLGEALGEEGDIGNRVIGGRDVLVV